MSSVVQGKVALITGGASGIGLAIAQELLRNGAKGVELVDINTNFLQNAKKLIANEFGSDKVDVTEADVSDKNQLEAAFQKAIQTFDQLDIVVNNAAIVDDFNYEKEIQINCNGVVHGTLLAVHDYLPKYRQGEEGYVVNISSISFKDAVGGLPVYTGTKYFIAGFSRAMGMKDHYERTKIKILTLCPGVTNTELIKASKCLGPDYSNLFLNAIKNEWPMQETSHVGRELVNVLKTAPSGTVWLIDNSKPASEITQ